MVLMMTGKKEEADGCRSEFKAGVGKVRPESLWAPSDSLKKLLFGSLVLKLSEKTEKSQFSLQKSNFRCCEISFVLLEIKDDFPS